MLSSYCKLLHMSFLKNRSALLGRFLCTYFATPSSALKQSSNCLLCLFAACSVSSLRFVVLWKVWKHVLHLTVWAAEFYIRLVHVPAKLEALLYRIAGQGDLTDFSCDLASLGPASPLRSRFCCALYSCQCSPSPSTAESRTSLRYPFC